MLVGSVAGVIHTPGATDTGFFAPIGEPPNIDVSTLVVRTVGSPR